VLISQKYEVLSEIGRGGMGIVYKVRHTSLETVSALKILPAHLADDAELVARFHREARVMAQLRHPNIVRVIDVDKSGDLHYFVMEYVDGRSLSRLIADNGPYGLGETLEIAIQLTRAMVYAHGRRPAVIHRDIKPSNILIEAETGRAVLTDFGLAKLAGGAESIRTETGKFIGTLRYCAPEQLTGTREMDVRVDVYALGMTIYEMHAGRPAYVDLEQPQVIAGLLQLSTEHPFRFERSVPDDFRRLIARATAKDRDRRYPTVEALLADLERLKDSLSPSRGATTVGTQLQPADGGKRRRQIALAGTAAIGLAVAGAVAMRESRLGVFDAPKESTTARSAAVSSPTAAAPDAADKPQSAIRKFVSVMDFSPGSPDPQFNWMRDAIRDNLNSRLSGASDCKVFSKEFLDFKAQQMVREGHYADVKSAVMEVAQKLGVTKAILGSYRADRGTLHIEAHLVDMETGVQEASETVEGDPTDFTDLQASLAKKLMARLGVTPPLPEPEAAQAAAGDTDLDNYRLLLEAEGRDGASQPAPAPTTPRKDKGRHGSAEPPSRAIDDVAAAILRVVDVPVAVALDVPAERVASAEQEIRETLERYRRACEQKDLTALEDIYDHLTPSQIDANRRYFDNAGDLQVAFEEIDVALGENEAAVSYTRRDRFIDKGTERPTKVDIRLTKIFVRVDGHWKIGAGRTGR
jgi:serine/threonine-protein kinase